MTNEANDQPEDDIETRIEKLKREAEKLSNGQMKSGVSPDCPAEIEEQFWKQVLAFEQAVEVEPFETLIQSGVTLPAAEELDDGQVTVKLKEVIDGMAFLGMYLFFTDHLTDRELYVRLWNDVLRVPTALQPDDPGAWHIDLTGSGSEEDRLTYLKYYADEDDRRWWAQEWPDDPLPDVEPLPFDRDRHLPRP